MGRSPSFTWVEPTPLTFLNPENSIIDAKNQMRQSVLARLRATTPEQRSAWSSAIVQWLTLSDAWVGHGGTVAIFGGLKLEADLLSLIPWMRARNLKPAFFAIEENYTLVPYLVYREDDLVPGVFGVLEPRRNPETRLGIEDIGSVLVPGRAFATDDGTRLGLGKGHYDRFLSAPGFRARKIGIGFALQMEPSVPGEGHDVKMEALVSETGWTAIGKPGLTAPSLPASGLPDDLSAEATKDFLLHLF